MPSVIPLKFFTEPGAGTTMNAAHLKQKVGCWAYLNLDGPVSAILWTSDATTGGTNIFASSPPPLITALAVDPSSDSTWTINGSQGAMLKNELSKDQWSITTYWAGSYWVTVVLQGGSYLVSGDPKGDSQTTNNRRVCLQAIGYGA